jgi:hypothetical protein
MKPGSLNLLEPSGPVHRPVMGLLYLLPIKNVIRFTKCGFTIYFKGYTVYLQ